MADERTYGSTTGDITWKKLDPKTYYLYNEHRDPPPEDEPKDEVPVGGGEGRSGDSQPDAKLLAEMFRQDMLVNGPTAAEERAKRALHIRQLADLNHDLRHGKDINVQDRI